MYTSKVLLVTFLFFLGSTSLSWAHFHENQLPKGWGEVKPLLPVRTPVANRSLYRTNLNTGEDGEDSSSTEYPDLEIPFTGEDGTIVDRSKGLYQRFVWHVTNFSTLLTSGQELIFSPRFYLSEPGYRMQLLLTPNTTYSDQVSYLGVFFRIVAGDYDSNLEWPYMHRTMLMVLNHGQLVNYTGDTMVKSIWNHSVIPNIDECRLRSAFLRPNSDQDTSASMDGCGNRRQVPLSELEGDTYLQDDTLLIVLSVRTVQDQGITDDESQPTFRRAAMTMRYNELVSNYQWAVSEFSRKREDAVRSGRIAILTSAPFYTHPNGYLIQLFLTILPKRSAFAVSIAFVQGDHDRYLQWPFPYPFEMAIVDQSPDYWKRDLTVKVKPSKSDCGTEAFSQPGLQPEFCFLTIQSLQVLSLTHYNFLQNDTLHIRFTTRFERYSARQRSSILFINGRLVSEFNWLIPGILARFERYLNEPTNSSTSPRKQQRFVSDEFYTNGQGYLCQLVLTVGTSSLNSTNSNDSTAMSSVLVFGLELVIIEGEFDRFLEWPFQSPYELSIVGYKSIESTGSPAAAGSESSSGGQLYHADPPGPSTSNSQLVLPSNLVSSGQCIKEAFQKPIERNPPCGIRNFVHLDLAKVLHQRHMRTIKNEANSTQFELMKGVSSSKADEDLHLRVRIYL